MIRVEEAFKIVQAGCLTPRMEEIDILHSVGRVLAETIHADRDFPPFNRVAMDGIAIASECFTGTNQEFVIEGTQAAGTPQRKLSNPNHCIEVMTGAMLPEGTDAVIRYEDLEIQSGKAKVLVEKIEGGMNVHPQAQDAKHGDVLLVPGQPISPAEMALLASIGKGKVNVFAFPNTAVISTGDELVGIHDTPAPHQIRSSNTYALQAAMRELQWHPETFHIADRKEEINSRLQKMLAENDVLIVSGGVSKGKFDFIPEALENLGIQKRFHQVKQRPGKPFWFGTSADGKKVVFALPGNPVSTFLCFFKYIKPWMLSCCGVVLKPASAVLAADVSFTPPLTYFIQVRTELHSGTRMAYPHAGGGSGDFANLKEVDGFLELPAEKSEFKAGESYPFISFRV